MDATKIGNRIKLTRKSRGLTQADLAQMVDLTPKYLSNLECGFKLPKFETFISIANALKVGCLKAKSESFRIRFVLFTTVRSADLPLFPSRPARFFRILGQKWVKHGALAPTPTAPRSPSRRRRQQDRPRRPHHSCSPAEYR